MEQVNETCKKSAQFRHVQSSTENNFHLSLLKQRAYKCKLCPLHKTRSQIVFADGDASCELMVVGEAPGFYEDREGIPFVGKAGKLLDCILAAPGVEIPRNKVYICNVIKCISGDTKVYLQDGTTAPISHLVKHRYSGKVACIVDEKLAYRRVTGWHRSVREGRDLFQISYVYQKNKGGKSQRAIVTEDHKILVDGPHMWSTAKEIFDSEEPVKICTGTLQPTPTQAAMLLGSVLGDGHINRHGGFSESHSIKQEDYLNFKTACLKTLQPTQTSLETITGGKTYPVVRYWLPNLPYFREMREIFYPGGKKIFPYEYVKEHTIDLTLAVWFMDNGNYYQKKNGSYSLTLHICGYSREDQKQIARFFTERGFKVSLWENGSLYFNQETAERFLDTIRPYIPEAMLYKVGYKDTDAKFIFADEPNPVFYSEAIVKKYTPRQQDKTVYCLDVEEAHNFLTPGGVVHNCWPGKGNPTPTKDQIETCFPFLKQQIELVKPKLIIAAGNPACFALGLLKVPSGITKIRGKEFTYENIPVIATYHPAALLRGFGRNKEEVEWDIKQKKKSAWSDWKLISKRFKELK